MKKWQRKPPLMDGKSILDQQVEFHLWDVNTRNGWNLEDKEPNTWSDRWFHWLLAIVVLIAIVIIAKFK